MYCYTQKYDKEREGAKTQGVEVFVNWNVVKEGGLADSVVLGKNVESPQKKYKKNRKVLIFRGYYKGRVGDWGEESEKKESEGRGRRATAKVKRALTS